MREKIPSFAVVGKSESGKTELICDLIKGLKKRDYNVASVKHTRGDFTVDSEEKDTWRHSKAGADLVVFSTPNESDFLLKRSLDLDKLISRIERFEDYDLVLIEGMKEENIPKISVDEEFKDESIIHYEGDLEPIFEKIDREIEVQKVIKELAGLDCGECGYPDCSELAKAVLEGEMTIDDCRKLESRKTVQLRINEEEISLGDFPAKMIEKTVRGMLSSLKGIEGDEKKIEIEINESES